ncbi:hypothetical protein D3C86_1847150 [compost metagenome]
MNLRFRPVRPGQCPFVKLFALPHAQPRPLAKFGRHSRFAQSRDELRARHKAVSTIGENAQHQIAVVKRTRANADRDINTLCHHIDAAVGGFQLQRHAWVTHHKLGQHRPDMNMQERDRTCYPYHAARFCL